MANALLALIGILYNGTFLPTLFGTNAAQFNVVGICVYANYWLILMALIPRSINYGGKGKGRIKQPTDGKQLLMMPFMKPHKLKMLLMVPMLAEAGELVENKEYDEALAMLNTMIAMYPDSIFLKRTAASIMATAMKLEEALSMFSSIECTDTEPTEQAYIHNGLAWVHLLSSQDPTLELADFHSQQAIELLHIPQIADTRGIVLIEREQIDEGLSLLVNLVDLKDPSNLSATMYMGYGLFLQGNTKDAEIHSSFVEKHREKLQPDEAFLFNRITQRMEGSSQPQ